MERLQRDFHQTSGDALTVVYGSTGKLVAQILNGAPFDVLLAADQARPIRLEIAGATVAGSRFTYAVGRLVLWAPEVVDLASRGPAALLDGADSLALANPELAPYGAAAVQTLRTLGVWERLSARVVTAENVGQAYTLVATGNAAAGFIALAQVDPEALRAASAGYWLVPPSLHEPLQQDAVLMRRARDNTAALAFMDYLRSDRARRIIAAAGYEDS